MKWIVGGLILAVVASVASGRVPLVWVVYCFAALFISMGVAIFFAFLRQRHYGLLLIGITYVASAIAAIAMTEWWPLVAGFALAWVLRAMGMEPEPDNAPEGDASSRAAVPPGEGDKKS